MDTTWHDEPSDVLETAIEVAKGAYRGWCALPGRPTIGQVRKVLDERGEARPAARVPTTETWQSWYPGWCKSATDGEVEDLERGATCHRCREEIETGADHTIAYVPGTDTLADFHTNCAPDRVRARIVR